MSRSHVASSHSVAAKTCPFPLDAYQFLKEGLDYTVHRLHGDPPPQFEKILDYMHRRGHDPHQLTEAYHRKKLPQSIMQLLDEVGGPDALESRHVTGPQLCEGLRDLALQRWGLLASAVLRHWNIRSTRDFGEMVFTLIRAGMLKKRSDDRLSDFDNVFDFEEAFERSYHIRVTQEV